MRALIVGGGIGGLAAAVALHHAGVDSVVIERARDSRAVGAGLGLWPNAMNALRALGLENRVLASSSRMEQIVTRTSAGRTIGTTDFRDIIQQAGAPCVCIHRAALRQILFDELPPGCLQTSKRCTGIDNSTAILEGGERMQADVLIGADGIWSVVRERLHGPKPPRYAGYTCWRGICLDHGTLPELSTLLVTGAGSEFGLWHCGKGQLYWFLTKNSPPGTTQPKANALAACRDWAAPVPKIIEGTPENAILQNDIVDRPPLRWWGTGAVTLLGDAAHPATPNLGQGACQALEDAVVLARCLTRIHPIEAALREYERLRIPRTTAIVRDSWRGGKVLQLEQSTLVSVRDWFLGGSIGAYTAQKLFRKLLTYQLPEPT